MIAIRTRLLPLAAAALLASSSAAGAEPLALDLRHHDFSRRGSWMSLVPIGRVATLQLYFARQWRDPDGNWLDLTFLTGGKDRPLAFAADPTRISIRAGGEAAPRAQAYLLGPLDTVIDARDMDLWLSSAKEQLPLQSARRVREGVFDLQADGWTCRIEVLAGTAAAPAARNWLFKAADGHLRLALRMFRGAAPAPIQADPGRDLAAIDRDWQAWRAKLPAVDPSRRRMAELAWWDLWSMIVPKDGILPTEGILENKYGMSAIWPWDTCFTALALGLGDLPLALDAFMIPLANMDEQGMLPDTVMADKAERGLSKPPIAGWALSKLMDRHRFSRQQLERVYDPLVKWTEFWFKHRDADGNGLPAWGGGHSGAESGWDNATILPDGNAKYEAPDLQAYLVLQMKALARIARELGRAFDAAQWDARADAHLRLTMRELWDGGKFVVRVEGSHAVDPHPTSLLPLIPLLLGEHLDPAVFARLADDLRDRFLTPFGPATDDPAGPRFLANGYWQGPVWAPTTYLLVDGLARGGRKDLARDIARSFCDLVERSGGHYENYDPVKGQGQSWKSYSWTAAVDILLLHEYLD